MSFVSAGTGAGFLETLLGLLGEPPGRSVRRDEVVAEAQRKHQPKQPQGNTSCHHLLRLYTRQ